MRHTTISGHHGTHHTVAAAFWILAGITAVIALGDVLTLLAVAPSDRPTSGIAVMNRLIRTGGLGGAQGHRMALRIERKQMRPPDRTRKAMTVCYAEIGRAHV